MTAKTKKRSRLEALQEQFPGKQINRLISFTKKCPLSRPARIIYSLLLFRCKRKGRNQPASISCLARLSTMHRSTVAKALEELRLRYVVDNEDGLWKLMHLDRIRPLPNPEWYGWRGRHHAISDLAYNWFVQPAKKSPLTLMDALVFSADLQKKVSAACLAVRLHCDRKTILRSRTRLSKSPVDLSWFASIRHKKAKPKVLSPAEFLATFTDGMQQAVVLKMLKASTPWTQEEIRRFFKIARDRRPNDVDLFDLMALLINEGPRCFDQIMREHENSHRPGSGMGLVMSKMGWA
jgi:hypothetical protein